MSIYKSSASEQIRSSLPSISNLQMRKELEITVTVTVMLMFPNVKNKKKGCFFAPLFSLVCQETKEKLSNFFKHVTITTVCASVVRKNQS